MSSYSGLHAPDLTSFTVKMGTEDVTVTFDAALMTGRWERDIRQSIAADDIDKVADKMLSVFIDWNVVDEQGQKVPISSDVLLNLPGKSLVNLFQGMQEAATPASEEGNGSSAISSSPSPDSSSMQASPQNGPTLSTSPQSSTLPSPT